MTTRRAFLGAATGAAISYSRIAGANHMGLTSAPAGRWDLTVRSASGEYGAWLELADGRLRVVGRVGGAKPIRDFTLDGQRLRFTNQEWFGRYEDVQYDLTIDGDAVRGAIARPSGEVMRVSGARAPDLKRAAPARWSEPVYLLSGMQAWQVMSATKPANWSIEDGVLSNARSGPNLRSATEFEDFRLVFEFNCPEGSNSGVFLRGRYELQLEEPGEKPGPPVRGNLSIYGYIAPQPEPPRGPGRWRKVEVTLIGRTVTVIIDGVKVIDNKEIPGPTGGNFNTREADLGPIMLQGDHGPIAFRDVFVSIPVLP